MARRRRVREYGYIQEGVTGVEVKGVGALYVSGGKM